MSCMLRSFFFLNQFKHSTENDTYLFYSKTFERNLIYISFLFVKQLYIPFRLKKISYTPLYFDTFKLINWEKLTFYVLSPNIPSRFYFECNFFPKTKSLTCEYKEFELESWECESNVLKVRNYKLGLEEGSDMVNKGNGWFIFLYNNIKKICGIAEKIKKKDIINL
jgi:hypothetical protein